MRLSALLPYGLLVATATLATAHSSDTNTFFSRTNDDLYLSAREVDAISLLARDYIVEALVARMDQPQRDHFKSLEDYEKAFRTWNRRTGKINRGTQDIVSQQTEQPQRVQFANSEAYEKAWREWNKTSRKVDRASQKLLRHQSDKSDKEQEKIKSGKTSVMQKIKNKAHEKGASIMNKILNKVKTKKAKRELAFAEWDELQ